MRCVPIFNLSVIILCQEFIFWGNLFRMDEEFIHCMQCSLAVRIIYTNIYRVYIFLIADSVYCTGTACELEIFLLLEKLKWTYVVCHTIVLTTLLIQSTHLRNSVYLLKWFISIWKRLQIKVSKRCALWWESKTV